MKSKLGLVFLTILYSFLLVVIFKRPISIFISSSFSLVGLFLEILGMILAVIFISHFYKKYGFCNTFSFFVPLFLIGALVEGDWILKQRFAFHKLNFFFWDTPVVIILYYSGAYLLYLLYQKLGEGWFNRLKALAIHLLADSLVTTPLAILFGFWTFRSTLFNVYPYIVPSVHLSEVSLGLSYVLFQKWLIAETRISEKLKPAVSLTLITCLLLIYAFTNHYFDRVI